MKKHGFLLKTFLMIIVSTVIFAFTVLYSSEFPKTMELLDKKTEGISLFFGFEKDFRAFSDFSAFSKSLIDEIQFFIERIRFTLNSIGKENPELPLFIITNNGLSPSGSDNLTSAFGEREDPFSGNNSFHSGIDIALTSGGDVFAAWPGRIIETGFDEIYGKYVFVEHSRGFITKYCHLSGITVQKGKTVAAGEKIAESGSTGRSTGSHLHFEIIINGVNIDPLEYIVL